jgi:hypothetical protein
VSAAFKAAENFLREVGSPAFPEYPQFTLTDIPGPLRLASRTPAGQSIIIEEVTPTTVWQGIIAPFNTDENAKLALRLLAVDHAIPVYGGTLYPGPNTQRIKPHPEEPRLHGTDLVFDVLVTEFEAPAHPWAFSLSPPIFQSRRRNHPHLRSDRTLQLPSTELHAFCVYSSAEFTFDPQRSLLPQFLDQVAIFLAKHVIWLKTQRLFTPTGAIIHDGIDMSTVLSTIPADAAWSIVPPTPTHWEGLWPGSSAVNGMNHLSLDPEKECWCGKGKLYKDCCLLWERAQYSRIHAL